MPVPYCGYPPARQPSNALRTLLVLALAAGCADTPSAPSVVAASDAGTATSLVTISPVTATIAAGAKSIFQAIDHSGSVPVVLTNCGWSSDNPFVATVSGGVATGVGAGSTLIKAGCSGDVATATVTVTGSPTTLAVSPTSATLAVGTTQKLSATVRDGSGNVIAAGTPGWSSRAPAVATVSGTGLVTAVAAGSATITATVEGMRGSALVTVAPPATVASVTLAPASATVAVGGTVLLMATAKDASGTVLTGQTVTWASAAPAIASVGAGGLVSGLAAGSATITATVGGKSAGATITVPVPSTVTAASVSVSPTNAALVVGGTQQLTATARDASGNVLSGRTFTWTSSAPAVASVSASGLVTGLVAGSATITVTVDGKVASTAITVSLPVSPGGLHEPAGMTTFVNDNGSVRVPAGMTATAPWSGASGWGDLHTALVSDPTNPTGSGMAIEKRWLAGDSTDDAARPGLISVFHWSALNPAFGPVKLLYVRLRVWLDPAWPGPDPFALGGFKFFYLTTSGSSNFVIWTSREAGASVQWASLLNGNVLARVGSITPGQWHTVEYLFQMNSAPGTSDGSASIWVDGTLLSSVAGITWVGAASTQWACNFDGMEIYPLRGMIGHTFPQADQMRYGEIYVSGH